MKKLAALAMAATIGAASLAPLPAQALTDTERAALAAILFLGMAAVAGRHGSGFNSGSEWDTDLYGEPFSPSEGIVCLPRPRQCFANGRLSQRWTQRIFG
jgi:hypothetical protein